MEHISRVKSCQQVANIVNPGGHLSTFTLTVITHRH